MPIRRIANRNKVIDMDSVGGLLHPTMPEQPFSEELRQWRKGLHLIQKEAADVLGVAVRTYIGWEAGNHEPANICIGCVRAKMGAAKPAQDEE